MAHSEAIRLGDGGGPRLRAGGEEFRALWEAHEVGIRPPDLKRFAHPDVGALDLHCQTLLDPDQLHRLLVFVAEPGGHTYEKVQLLAVIGSQRIAS